MPCTPPPPPVLSESDRMFIGSSCQYVHDPIRSNDRGISTSSIVGQRLDISMPTVENENTIPIMEFLENPGRLIRPRKICIIIRGPPGSGKSYVAKLIKEKERRMADDNLRILSIDDYYLVETETTEISPLTGKKVEYDDGYSSSISILRCLSILNFVYRSPGKL